MKRMLALLIVFSLFLGCVSALSEAAADGEAVAAAVTGADDLLSKGLQYLYAQSYDHALACYRLAQRLHPDQADGYLGEAVVYMNLEDYAAAETCIEQALSVDPISYSAWLIKCALDVATEDIAAFEADAIYAEVLNVDLSGICGQIALMYAKDEKYESAAKYFDRAAFTPEDEIQTTLYKYTLLATDQREKAEALGLVPVNLRNRALDSAFVSGKLALVPAEAPAVAAQDFEISEAALAYFQISADDAAEMLASALETGAPIWYSFSPGGSSGIFTLDGKPFVWREGKCRAVYPSETRGVADEYENLKKYASYITERFAAMHAAEGVVYSPDGRYAAIFNYKLPMVNSQFFLDPIIMDLSTGELVLTATYTSRTREENCGVVTSACFSADGQYFYYMLYAERVYRHGALYRYNLETCETELCVFSYDDYKALFDTYDGQHYFCYPGLWETADGSLLLIRDVLSSDKKWGIVRIANSGRDWKTEAYAFNDGTTLADYLSQHSIRDSGYGWTLTDYPVSLARHRISCALSSYSANSGLAVLGIETPLDFSRYYTFTIQVEDFQFGARELDAYWYIDIETSKMICLTGEAFMALLEEHLVSLDKNNSIFRDLPCMEIRFCSLSPDGNYALLLATNGSSDPALYLLRLEDMELKQIEGIDADKIVYSGAFDPIIEWNCDTLIINTTDGITLWRFS